MFTPNACEGTTTLLPYHILISVKRFFLSPVSLYAIAGSRCYDFGPVAAPVKPNAILPNFDDDAEGAFVEHEENSKFKKDWYDILYVVGILYGRIDYLGRNIENLKADAPFTRYTYDGRIVKLMAMGSDIKYGEDLGNDDSLLTKTKKCQCLSKMAKEYQTILYETLGGKS